MTSSRIDHPNASPTNPRPSNSRRSPSPTWPIHAAGLTAMSALLALSWVMLRDPHHFWTWTIPLVTTSTSSPCTPELFDHWMRLPAELAERRDRLTVCQADWVRQRERLKSWIQITPVNQDTPASGDRVSRTSLADALESTVRRAGLEPIDIRFDEQVVAEENNLLHWSTVRVTAIGDYVSLCRFIERSTRHGSLQGVVIRWSRLGTDTMPDEAPDDGTTKDSTPGRDGEIELLFRLPELPPDSPAAHWWIDQA